MGTKIKIVHSSDKTEDEPDYKIALKLHAIGDYKAWCYRFLIHTHTATPTNVLYITNASIHPSIIYLATYLSEQML